MIDTENKIRSVYFPLDDRVHNVGNSTLMGELTDEDGNPRSKEAENIDNTIFVYVSDEALTSLSDVELSKAAWGVAGFPTPMNEKEYTVESSHGELTIAADGKVLSRTPPCCEECVEDIASFDLYEWLDFWKKDYLPEYFDILDLGGVMASGRPFNASEHYRRTVTGPY